MRFLLGEKDAWLNLKSWQKPYLILAIALLVQLIVYPIMKGAISVMIMNVISSITVVAAIYAIGSGRKQLIVALVLGGFAFFGIWYVAFIQPRYYLAIFSVICRMLFSVYIVVLILLSLFRSRRVSSDTIFGAVSVYLLIGMSFSVLYVFLENFFPGSFCINQAASSADQFGLSTMIYFSFTTLTTLGYGDITPASPISRAASNIEALLGVLSLVILISRFVGIHVSQSMVNDKDT